MNVFAHAVLVSTFTTLVGCAHAPEPCPPAHATASIAEDGTITLQSVRFGTGPVTQPRRAYAVDHPHYAQVLAHVGTIEPETEKLVEDWPAVTCE